MNGRRLLLGINLIIAISAVVLGLTEHVQAAIRNIAVTPVVGESSVTDRFQLRVKPGETRVITLAVSNYGRTPIRIKLTPTNAVTTSNGNVKYTQDVNDNQHNLQVRFNRVTNTKVVTIKADQVKEISFKLRIPERRFKGIVMGGIYLQKAGEQQRTDYIESLAIPVWLQEKAVKTVPTAIKFKSITGRSLHEQTTLGVNFVNPQPVYFKNVSADLKVERKNWLGLGKQTFRVAKNNMTFAANSLIPLTISLADRPIPSGYYHITGTLNINGQFYKVDQKTKLSLMAAYRATKRSTNVIYDFTPLLIGAIIGVILIIVGILLRLSLTSRKQAKGKR
ncbi:DUF916 domain-containing protein [Loigolactobacillus binensis]|uniref:WxL protein peptidoglycan domain-containing protein n=1 Tax=Loigolactobacillus binensis TaxID=2559922 RepID=A0ABW3EEU9_9LACO|nr:DUF916 domain-containing protein [Loigolactobacillus binensis]